MTTSISGIKSGIDQNPFSADWNNPMDLEIDMDVKSSSWGQAINDLMNLFNSSEELNIRIKKLRMNRKRTTKKKIKVRVKKFINIILK